MSVPSGRTPLCFGRYDYAAFLTYFAYAAASIIIPVCLVELAHELSFDLSEGGRAAGGALHLGRTLAMVVAMLVVGFVAGRYGTRKTLGGSVLLMSLGILFCGLSPIYGMLFLAVLLAGLGEGVIEGLGTPFVQKLHIHEPGRYINFAHAFWSVGILVTVVLSGWLLFIGVSWRTLTLGVALSGIAAGCLILWPSPRGRKYPEEDTKVDIRQVCQHARRILSSRDFWRYYAAMFMAGGGEFCLTFWSASHIRLHFDASAWAGGLGVAIFAAAMVAGRFAAGYFVPQDQLRKLIVLSGLVGAMVTVFLPFAKELSYFYALLFLAGLATAPFWPSIQSYAAAKLPELDSTMLLILLSCAGVPGCGFFAYLMGVWGDLADTLVYAFFLVPAAYFLIFVLIGWTPKNPGKSYPSSESPIK